MARMPTIVFALLLLCMLGWYSIPSEPPLFAAAIDAFVSEWIAGTLFEWFGDWNGDGFETDRPAFAYTETLMRIGGLLVAASIGYATASLLKTARYRREEEEFKRQIYEAKSRVPQLETSLRNRELAVTRLKMELDEWQQKLEGLSRQLAERDQQLRDRDRGITRLGAEVAMLRSVARSANEDHSAGHPLVLLEEHSRAFAEQAVADQLTRTKIAELTAALDDAQRKIAQMERERDRQDRWLDILNDQLSRARETNERLASASGDIGAARVRIAELEREIVRLKEELADRDRRLATSRFECANARTTVAHLRAEIERRDGAITH